MTGGIGAGKSVVCRIAALQGLPLYDCDIEERRIMDSDMRIKQTLAQIAGQEVLRPDGEIDRPLLAKRLFADADVRRRVNELVHVAVRSHLAEWVASLSAPTALVESAILY
ncbi:MAG: dephospho-CoA kinase, partial [Muribaculaceae bacterium]|nr:dephospho-CoA kinase [Muribaculaceae bacterium]